MSIIVKLALAITAEHEARTGHKHSSDPLKNIGCDVCMNIRSIWREMEDNQNNYIQEIMDE